MEDFKDQVKRSFQACKSDIEALQEENKDLKQQISQLNTNNQALSEQIQSLQNENQELNSEISNLKAELKGVHIALDYIKEFTEPLRQQQQQPQESPEPVTQPQKPAPSKPKQSEHKDPYEALLAFKAKTNKRELLKQKLTTLITEEGLSLSELKFMFVDHYRYCSKATFYNYLKELELEKAVVIERENAKNKVYLKQFQ